MKKYLLNLLLLVLGCLNFLFRPALVLAQSDTGWQIDSFSSEVIINEDTSVDVTETINVNFNALNKHGIFRTIPVKYTTKIGNNLNINFNLQGVINPEGQAYPVTQSYSGNDVILKIGDPDKTISGRQIYVIRYQINQVITTPNDNAEFYWNVTGSSWPVPINNITATIKAPPSSVLNTICFTGTSGSNQTNCTHNLTPQTAQFSASALSPGEGLTVAVTLDKTKFRFPSLAAKSRWFFRDNFLYLLPIVTLAFMYWLYWRIGRDKEYKGLFDHSQTQTVPLFSQLNPMLTFGPPKDLPPGEAGVIIDEKVQMRDVTAVVIDLARRGFFNITEIPKKGFFGSVNFELNLKHKSEAKLKDYEKSILNMLFGSSRSDKTTFKKLPASSYKDLAAAKKQLYEAVVKSGYFAANPQTTRIIFLILGIVFGAIGLFVIAPILLALGLGAGAYFGFGLSAVIIVVFSIFMPARTAKGRGALAEIVGLKEWVEVGAWREKIHEKLNLFEEILPFAIAFGLTQKFIKVLKDAAIKPPNWYHTSGDFNIIYFSSSMNSFTRSLQSGVAATAPHSASSGGSGFSGGSSGGGFGGGGGGSW